MYIKCKSKLKGLCVLSKEFSLKVFFTANKFDFGRSYLRGIVTQEVWLKYPNVVTYNKERKSNLFLKQMLSKYFA